MRKDAVLAERDVRRRALLDHLSGLLPAPDQLDSFCHHMVTEPPATVRVNSLMPQADALTSALASMPGTRRVAWCRDAFVLPQLGSPRLGCSLEFGLGGLYIQAAATTLAVAALDPQPGERVLDLAAAPGGKATQIAAAMDNQGLLVANEPQSRRVPALVGNFDRCGVSNAVVTRLPGTLLARHFHNFFDRVLLDAPCSGDGILCKNETLLRYWSPQDAANKGAIQTGLLRAAFHMLRPGGILVYSTCSLSTEENEDVVIALMRRYPGQVEVLPLEEIEPAPIPADLAAGYPDVFAHMKRVWPHLHQTEGAFVARLRKTGPATQWRGSEGDVGKSIDEGATAAALAGTETSAAIAEFERSVAQTWGVALTEQLTGGQILVETKHANLKPVGWETLEQVHGYVRSGMRLATLHRGHAYLTQQAVTSLADVMVKPAVELTWPQTQEVFAGRDVLLSEPVDVKGEAVFRFGQWAVCRGLVTEEGRHLQNFLPKARRTGELCRLSEV